MVKNKISPEVAPGPICKSTLVAAMFGNPTTMGPGDLDCVKIRLDQIRNAVMCISVMIALVSAIVGYRAWHDYHVRAKKDRAIVLLQDLSKSLTPTSRAAQHLQSHFKVGQFEFLNQGAEFEIETTDQDLLEAAIQSSTPQNFTVPDQTAFDQRLLDQKLLMWLKKTIGRVSFSPNLLTWLECLLSPSSNQQAKAAKLPYKISRKQSFELRWQIVSFLNALEVVCQAYSQDVADQEIIIEELDGLYTAKTGFFCDKYRNFIDLYHDADPPGVAPSYKKTQHYPGIEKVVNALKNRREKTTQ